MFVDLSNEYMAMTLFSIVKLTVQAYGYAISLALSERLLRT